VEDLAGDDGALGTQPPGAEPSGAAGRALKSAAWAPDTREESSDRTHPRTPTPPARTAVTTASAPRTLLIVLLAVMLLATAVVPAAQAAPAVPDAETEMLRLINRDRASQGLRPLSVDMQLTRVARDWSDQMAGAGRISHRPSLSSFVSSGWRRLAENVGVGPSLPRLHDAFMASPGHRSNVLGDFDRVGIGVVEHGGRLWATVNFRLGGSGPAFVDISGDTHRRGIEAVFLRGTTTGCSADRFCPSRGVTRGQMASFLARELGLSPTAARFSDVPSRHPHAGNIGALAAAGVTSGCGGGRFCPDAPVTRAQMATFLRQAMGIAPKAPKGVSDVASDHPHAGSIGALQAAGVTQGCNSRQFCPSQPVTRGQMATFLDRAFG
jgi:uncharacterized protein YkwD